MRILSEKTKKEYATVEECLADEAKYDAMVAKKKEEAEKKAAERKERAKEVEEAYKAAREAEKHYVELRNKFVKDYGSFHMTYHTTEKPLTFEDIFKMCMF